MRQIGAIFEAIKLRKKLRPFLKFKPLKGVEKSFYISEKNKFVFVTNAKVATTTIKGSLWRFELGDPNLVIGKIHYFDNNPFKSIIQYDEPLKLLEREDLFKFCIVRNPYTRILSAYLDKVQKQTPMRKAVLEKLGNISDIQDQDIPFDAFVDLLCDKSFRNLDNHWRPQVNNLYLGLFSYNLIGRLEHMDEFYDSLISHFGDDFADYFIRFSPHKTSSSDKINEFYTPSLKEKVFQAYIQDFKSFGYDK